MAHAPEHPPNADTGAAARYFFTAQALLSNPDLAFLYTDLIVNSPTTIKTARSRTEFKKSTAYKYANELAELGVTTEIDRHVGGAAPWETDPITGIWSGEDEFTLSPTVIAVYGATSVDDDLDLFVDRHGTSALAPAVTETVAYLRGERTRRGVAVELGVPAAEGIAVSQAIEGIVAVVVDADPTLGTESLRSRRTTEWLPTRRTLEAMSEVSSAVGPLPSALVVDTSFLRTLGGPSRDRYQSFTSHVRAADHRLFLTESVVTELREQAGYVGGDWIGLAETTDWVERLGPIQPGVRVHDGPGQVKSLTGRTDDLRVSNRKIQTNFEEQTPSSPVLR